MQSSNVSVRIPNGNAVAVSVSWFNTAGVAEIPTAGRYQVFDYETRASASSIVTLSGMAAIMNFVVAGSSLPGNSTPSRRLVIDVEATFSAGDKDTATLSVYVMRGYTLG